MQLADIPVQICVCRTVPGELPSDIFIKFTKFDLRLKAVTQGDNPISN
jgi:hypothetical protein